MILETEERALSYRDDLVRYNEYLTSLWILSASLKLKWNVKLVESVQRYLCLLCSTRVYEYSKNDVCKIKRASCYILN
jgi:hypothetical protein